MSEQDDNEVAQEVTETMAIRAVGSSAGPYILALIMAFVLLIGSLIGLGVVSNATRANACSGSGTSDISASANPALFRAIKDEVAGDAKLGFAGFFGSNIESDWRSDIIAGGAYGSWSIQHPAGAPLPGPPINPRITVAGALDPFVSTKYMMPRYRDALSKVPDALWQTDPMSAAEQVAFIAEDPAQLYRDSRGLDAVEASYKAALAAMKMVGLTTDFSSVSIGTTACASSVTATGDLIDPGPGPQDPSGQGVFFNLRPRTVNLIKYVQANWDCGVPAPPACVSGYGGWRLKDGDPSHPGGFGVDFTISTSIGTWPTTQQTSFGWGVACFMADNADKLGIEYIIWQKKIWNISRTSEGGTGGCNSNKIGWREYTCIIYGGVCGVTTGHYDHIHVTLKLT